MTEKKDLAAIIEYLNGLNPHNPLEVVRVSGEVKALSQALIALTERINAPRQIKLWKEEVAQLRSEIEKLYSGLEQAKALDKEIHELVEQRAQLLAQKEAIEDLSTQKEEIFQLKAFVSKHDLSALRLDLENLRETAREDMAMVKAWICEILDFFHEMKSDALSDILTLLSNLEQNRKLMEDAMKDAQTDINLKKIELSKWMQPYDIQLHETQNAYNELATQLNDIKSKMAEIKEKHAKNVAAYEAHFVQNKAVWGELGKRHNLDTHINQIIESTEKNLLYFDQEIKSLLRRVDHLTVF
ncbi:MAG: hypothetical protein CV087_19720 [Candidatus Brocadia sp. WS118]|nr:MAG: hypothetical protein CV087_19720 [Candidatus Brocadia sp. WS118]